MTALGIRYSRDLPAFGTPIGSLAALADHEVGYGTRLGRVPGLAAAFRAEFGSSGKPDQVSTHDLITLPYPTRFALWRAATTFAPFVSITNRMLIIRWTEQDGRRRVLLFEPSDVERGVATPYFAQLAARTPGPLRNLLVTVHGDVLEHLAAVGLDPAEVDYLVFDHLHTQDVRRWLGTTAPQPDLGASEPLVAAFPNARLIVQRSELDAMADLHPLQKPWYQAETYRDLPPESLWAIDGDTLVAPGVALLSTPGHVTGNQTLVLNTDSGIWASSENAIAVECLWPEHSKIPGLAKSARRWQREVILNANTLETTAAQYNSMVLEKHLVDRSQTDSRFGQFFPSSELTRNRLNPGTGPTVKHGVLTHGQAGLVDSGGSSDMVG
jgi:hypothetical protein